MKRRIVAFLCAVGWLLSLTACGGTGAVSSDVSDVPNESDEFVPDTTTTVPPTTTTAAPLTAEQKQELQIKQAYLAYQQARGYLKNFSPEKIDVHKTYGTWNGVIAVSVSPGTNRTGLYDGTGTTIAGYLVGARHISEVWLFKNEEVKELNQGYEDGWVSKTDVEEILRILIPDFENELLLGEVRRRMVAFLKEQYPNGSEAFGHLRQLTPESVSIMGCHAYDGFDLYYLWTDVFMDADISPDALLTIDLAGYTFTVRRDSWIQYFIYKDGQVKHLPQAYEAGWLDEETLYEVLKERNVEFE